MSPMPRAFLNAVGGPAGAGEWGGVTATAKGREWGGEESLKTPKPGASGLGRTWGQGEFWRADGAKGGGGGRGVRKERERDIPPTPITTGRTRRRTRSASGLVPALRRGQSGSVAAPGLTLDGPSSTPSPPTAAAAAAAAATAAGARNFRRQSMSPSRIESGAGGNSGGDDAAAAGSRPPMSPRGSASGGGGDAGPPPKTPARPRGGGGANPDRLTPPDTAGATRKAKKLVVIRAAAAAAETAAFNRSAGGDGAGAGGDQQPGTQDLLALANAVAVGVAPPTRAPRRGRKLMRYLSHDAGPADGSSPAASNGTPSARGFMRINSSQGPSAQPPGSVPRMGRKKMALRRLNSLSAAAWGARAESVSDSGSRSPPPPRPPGGRSVPALGGAGGAPAASRNAPTNPVPATTTTDPAFAATATSVTVTTTTPTSGGGSVPTASVASPMTDSSPRARASDASGSHIFNSPGYGKNDPAAAAAAVPARDPVAAIDQQRRGRVGDSPAHGAGAGGGHTRASVSEGGNGAAATAASVARVPPPMPNTIVLPSTEVRLGLPHSNISPLLKAERGVFPFVPDGAERAEEDDEEEALQASAGAEEVVRDCLYNSHGMVALDGHLWKPGSIRLVRRWMMLVDNTLYYFVKPG